MPYKPHIFSSYPKTNRDEWVARSGGLSDSEIRIAKSFGMEYFDGPRKFGLGGYYYDPKFFTGLVGAFISEYAISDMSEILDVGCAKGFMLYDFKRLLPGISIAGIDISSYALSHAPEPVKHNLVLGSCDALPYPDNAFDLVISLSTIHNLDVDGVKRSLREIVRVTRRHAFIRVNGYRNELEKARLNGWNLVADTILSVEQWEALFRETGYIFDYDFFVP